MTKFTDNLWRDLVQEHGATFARVDRTKPDRVRRPRTRVIAGTTLVLTAVGTVLALTLTAPGRTAATGGTSAAGGSRVVTAAYTITRSDNGSVLVELNQNGIVPVNAKLTAMGIHEQVDIHMASGPATVKGPVDLYAGAGCAGADGEDSRRHGRHGSHRAGHHRRQHGRRHLAHGDCRTFKTGDTGPGTGNSGRHTGSAPRLPLRQQADLQWFITGE